MEAKFDHSEVMTSLAWMSAGAVADPLRPEGSLKRRMRSSACAEPKSSAAAPAAKPKSSELLRVASWVNKYRYTGLFCDLK